MFTSIIGDMSNGLSFVDGLLLALCAIVLGLLIAYVYIIQGTHTKNFVITLALLPILVAFVILMVNGNLGTGIAVLGAFSLVRFRSIPGTSREIIFIFFAMSIGLAIGMGQIVFAAFVAVIVSLVSTILFKVNFIKTKHTQRDLKVIIPEDLDYTNIFDDIFKKYVSEFELVKVKTIQLGSLIEMSYQIEMKDILDEKKMIDEIRCRNGNLTVICAKRAVISDEL